MKIKSPTKEEKEKKPKRKNLRSISQRHPKFELAHDMMLGIRYTVSLSEPLVTSTSATTPTTSQFVETKKYKFPSEGSDTTPAHQMANFEFKDYCPQIFRKIREFFNISTQQYLNTICGDFKLSEFMSNSNSGQFFFFTYNEQFIIKTMTKTESNFLRKILRCYYTHIQNHDTLLSKFYGMHRVKRKKETFYFLIQQNVFYSEVENIIDNQHKYDLKGSTQGRRASKATKAMLKDLDWIDEGKVITIGPNQAKLFKDQLKLDTEWLSTQKIMDYSLLVGIHYRNRARTDPPIVLDHCSNDNKEDPEDAEDSIDHNHNNNKSPNLKISDMNNNNHTPSLTDDDVMMDKIRSQSADIHPKLEYNEYDKQFLDNNDADIEVAENTNRNSDICGWNRYHGGIVYKDDIYFVGLIDILQKYNNRKKMHNCVLKIKYDQNSISAVPPDLYAQRMCDFLGDKVV